MTPESAALDRLHNHLSEILGPADAGTLMAVVTAVDSDQLATKDDLHHEVALLRTEMVALKHELVATFRGELNAAITAQTRPLLIALVSTAVVFAGSLLAAVGIT